MTPEEYWAQEGIRFLNEDGTLPTVEERVKEGFRAGYWNGINEVGETVQEKREEKK